MDKKLKRFVDRMRKLRTEKLSKMGRFFFKFGISANLMTFVSLITGLLTVHFLFYDYSLYFLFGLIHFITDGLDGVIARVSKTTVFGDYFDHISDNFIMVLILVKLGWYIQDYYAYLVAGLFVIALIIYFTSKKTAPIVFMRSTALGILAIFTIPAFAQYHKILLTIGYLIAGFFTLFSLARQLQWYFGKRVS